MIRMAELGISPEWIEKVQEFISSPLARIIPSWVLFNVVSAVMVEAG